MSKEEARKPLSEIEVGDRVWISSRHNKRIQAVQRLTRTQIIVDGHTTRFERGKPPKYPHLSSSPTYYEIGGSSFDSQVITAIATSEECAQWDIEQETKKQEADAARAERARIDSLRQELTALFGEYVTVTQSYHTQDRDWEVHMYLSEDGVRRLAELIKNESL